MDNHRHLLWRDPTADSVSRTLPSSAPLSTPRRTPASLSLCVLSGMTASTCLAVLFVPALFRLLQHLEERLHPSVAGVTPSDVKATQRR
jgi:hypothetical protein